MHVRTMASWLVRIEDLDMPRNAAGATEAILAQLHRCGLVADAPPLLQSSRGEAYAAALATLVASGDAYPCGCSRADLERTASPASMPRDRHAERVYPGTCRHGLGDKAPRSCRLRTDAAVVTWTDRRLGTVHQDVAKAVGDFVLRRADGVWAYQLAVVVDDAAQGVTDVVRGEDLASNTARQILLQRRLGLPTPRYLHVPLVLADNGDKLSKQTGARPLDADAPLADLRTAGAVLGVLVDGTTVAGWLAAAVERWRAVQPPR